MTPSARTRPEPRITLAAEGRPFVLVPLGLAGLAAVAAPALGGPGPWLVAGAALLVASFCAFFFRDPRRSPPDDPDAIVSPADGRVMAVEQRAGRWRIAIFLSVLDVHVNRAPESGRVDDVAYHRGRFRAAFRADAAQVNERNHVRFDGPRGPFEVVQIAGLIARRIVCRVGPGDTLARGDRFGLIRFGSCTELWLPEHVTPAVAPGARVRGGETVVARWPAAEGSPR
ncbi:MAG: phosphatidylserine decarboxylase family protein [Acidobacteriota bacterium]